MTSSRRGVTLMKGARATGIFREGGAVAVRCDDGRVAHGSHALLAIGSVPNSEGLGLDEAGVEVDGGGYVPVNQHCQSNVPHVYAAGDVSGRLPLASVASMQGRKVAEHVMGLHTREHRHLDYDKAASAIFTEPEIADVGLAEAEAFAIGRKIRVTKVPFVSEPPRPDRRRSSRVREDRLGPGDRASSSAGRSSASTRVGADLGDRPGGHRQPQGD